MREQETTMEFHSPLGELMSRFIREKQACGYRYNIGLHALRRLDNFLCEWGLHRYFAQRGGRALDSQT